MDNTTTYIIVSALSAVFIGMLKVLYESKCKKVICCCGLVNVERDTEIELKEDRMKLEHQNKSTELNPTLTNIV